MKLGIHARPYFELRQTVVQIGDVWTWQRPDKKWRLMLVQRIQNGPSGPRACGIHPQSGRRLTCSLSNLMKGRYEARLVSRPEVAHAAE